VRVVLVSQVPAASQGLTTLLHALGHEPVALLCVRQNVDRYSEFAEHVRDAPAGLDILVPSARERIAPLLRTYEPDLLLCAAFPWKIPPDALAVPRLGAVNGHPSLLPRYRGPSPVSWAIRNGDDEIGFTFHRMDADLDTGAILAQGSVALEDEHSWDELEPKLVGLVTDLFPRALERVESGDPGDPQPDGVGEYLSFFEPEYAWIDLETPRSEVYRQVRAWRFHSPTAAERGALVELDGETVRVLRVSLEPTEGSVLACADGPVWVVEREPVEAGLVVPLG
jgi:methionyl-tRNA formyltransferase